MNYRDLEILSTSIKWISFLISIWISFFVAKNFGEWLFIIFIWYFIIEFLLALIIWIIIDIVYNKNKNKNP